MCFFCRVYSRWMKITITAMTVCGNIFPVIHRPNYKQNALQQYLVTWTGFCCRDLRRSAEKAKWHLGHRRWRPLWRRTNTAATELLRGIARLVDTIIMVTMLSINILISMLTRRCRSMTVAGTERPAGVSTWSFQAPVILPPPPTTRLVPDGPSTIITISRPASTTWPPPEVTRRVEPEVLTAVHAWMCDSCRMLLAVTCRHGLIKVSVHCKTVRDIIQVEFSYVR